ncbi:MAG: SpoIIE family protein phosphatase [Ignavibacteriaceae bacterium]
MNRFRIIVVLKIILILAFLLAGLFILEKHGLWVYQVLFFSAAVYQSYSLFKFIDKINRDLKRFLTSIKYSDFTQTYLQKNFGNSYKDLYNSIAVTYGNLSSDRLRAEENLQYLKTLIEQVPSGIISYKENGQIELINQAAKRLLSIGDKGNINMIKEEKEYLKYLLDDIEIGREKTAKFFIGAKEKNISVFASKFKLRNILYTLVTFKDLEDELEKKRLENELNIAQDIQSSLLPQKLPELKNYEIATMFKPAKRVGGDFYDFFQLDENRYGIIIGDVSGKGLGAAIYTTLIKGIFQTLAYECSSTAELFVKANSLIYSMLDKKSFITAIYAILDTANNTLTFSRAGHEPLLVYESDGTQFSYHKGKGIGLGLEKGKKLRDNLEECIINIKEKDILLFYTDGLVDMDYSSADDEAMNNFKAVVSANDEKGVKVILNEFANYISKSAEKIEQFDDITIIAVKRNV